MRWLEAGVWWSAFVASQGFDVRSCPHCPTGEAYRELLQPQAVDPSPHSDVHVLWTSQIEVVPITEDIGGWEPASFHEDLAAEAIRGWSDFRDNIGPSLKRGHPLRHQLDQRHAGALNDAFFHWQKRLFEAEGDYDKSLADDEAEFSTPLPSANSSWPGMNALPAYQKLRKYVQYFSRRYLMRSGMKPEMANSLNYSLFNWCAINKAGEFHGPHTHVGEYHVAVFYAQVGPAGGKIRFGDPRGQSPPFGKHFFHTPKSGHLVIFPSWLSHMATVTGASSDILEKSKNDDTKRVIFSFNVGPLTGPLPCPLWWSDPTSDVGFSRRAKIDAAALLGSLHKIVDAK